MSSPTMYSAQGTAPGPLVRPKPSSPSLLKKPAKKGIPASADVPLRKHSSVRRILAATPPMRRMSCSSWSAWMTLPAAISATP